jgi:hypothetical protein
MNLLTLFNYLINVSKNVSIISKNNEYHIVDKVQYTYTYENTLIFDLIDNVVFVVFALYSRIFLSSFWQINTFQIF